MKLVWNPQADLITLGSGDPALQDTSEEGSEMTMNLVASETRTLICKYLPELPPVVSDWQQSCQQPRCPHYCLGECCNPGRHCPSAACPFDGMELQLEDAMESMEGNSSFGHHDLPKKG
jgi:hypothetical protein